jgi:putative transposase
MQDNPFPHRRSCRLPTFDYSLPSAYSITICVQNRICLFGQIKHGQLHLNAAGEMAEKWWRRLPEKFPSVRIDEFVVMPNHFHGIVFLFESNNETRNDTGGHVGPPLHLHRIVQWFKTMTTNEYFRGVKEHRWEDVPNRLWQRSFHDHILRSESDLAKHRNYILQNPANWETDEEYAQAS